MSMKHSNAPLGSVPPKDMANPIWTGTPMGWMQGPELPWDRPNPIIDKDNAPKWDPPTPEGVTDAMIDQIFAPMPAGEEWRPLED